MSLQKLAAQFGFNVDAKSVDAAINSIGSIDREVSRVGRGINKFVGLLGAGGIGAGIYTFAKDAVNEFAKEEQAIGQLNNALGNLGITNRAATDDLVEFAKAQAKVSMATDEEIIAAERSLVQRGLWGEGLKQAIKDSLNLATKTGDLASAADVVGKSFQGVTRGLNLLGIQIDENLPKAKVFEEVHKQINERFSGAAVAAMGGYAGQVHILTVEMDDLKKAVGERVLPVFKFWIEYLNDILSKTDKIASGGDKMTAGTSNYISALPGLLAKQKELEMTAASQAQHGGKISAELQKQLDLYEKIISRTKEFEARQSKPVNKGSSVPTKPTVSAAIEVNIPNEVKEIDSATESWLRANSAMEDYYNDYLNKSAVFVAAIRPTEELRARVNTETWKKIQSDWKDAEQKNKATVEEMKTAWEEGSKSIAGGWAQALIVMQQNANNWRSNWLQVMNASVGPAKTAIHDLFTSSSKDFLNLEAAAKKMFQGILNAFLDLVAQIIAKKAILALFSGGAGLLPGVGSFFGFAGGGYTGDGNPNDVAGVVHKGEYVLDAETTKSIRGGSMISGSPSMAAAGGSRGVSITQNITLNGSGGTDDIGALCEKIAEATRTGLRQAGEMANVVTKVGAKKAGITGL